MNEIDITNKSVCIFGLRGSGKSVLLRTISEPYGQRALIYDTVRDIPNDFPVFAYTPINPQSVDEFEKITKYVTDSKRFSLFGIDEASRFCPSKPSPLPPTIALLNDLFRHSQYGYMGELTMLYIARRPVSLNQDLTELSDYLVIFKIAGKNDKQYLNDLSTGLGDVAMMLKQYYFVLVFPDRSYKLCKPVKYVKYRDIVQDMKEGVLNERRDFNRLP